MIRRRRCPAASTQWDGRRLPPLLLRSSRRNSLLRGRPWPGGISRCRSPSAVALQPTTSAHGCRWERRRRARVAVNSAQTASKARRSHRLTKNAVAGVALPRSRAGGPLASLPGLGRHHGWPKTSVPAVGDLVPPCPARLSVDGLNVVQAPADLDARAVPPIRACRRHLAAWHGLRDAVGA